MKASTQGLVLVLSALLKVRVTKAISNPVISNESLDQHNRLLESKASKGGKAGKTTKSSKSALPPCASMIAHQLGWSNWYHSVETHAPVFRIQSDKELREIIKSSQTHRGETLCTVRPVGSTHTYDGMVMQRTEEDVVLVSLVDYVPDDEAWMPSVNVDQGIVRLLAGQSWYDAVALYRHHGLVMPERTLGRFFSVGGVIANAVHGGSREGGFISTLWLPKCCESDLC